MSIKPEKGGHYFITKELEKKNWLTEQKRTKPSEIARHLNRIEALRKRSPGPVETVGEGKRKENLGPPAAYRPDAVSSQQNTTSDQSRPLMVRASTERPGPCRNMIGYNSFSQGYNKLFTQVRNASAWDVISVVKQVTKNNFIIKRPAFWPIFLPLLGYSHRSETLQPLMSYSIIKHI